MIDVNGAYTPTQREMKDTANIRFINSTMAKIIVEQGEPRGLFIQRDRGGFVGIDNRTGTAWIKRFSTKMGCLDWLSGVKSCEEIWKMEKQQREENFTEVRLV